MESHAYNHRGEKLRLIGTGKGGGEGKIYRIESKPLSCAKLYHAEKVTDELHEKILVMVNNPPDDPTGVMSSKYRSIGWPEAVLYRDSSMSRFAGFTMPFVDLGTFQESHKFYDPDDRVKLLGGSFTWRHLMTAACNLASTIAAVHQRGHCIGDLRETNILVASSALVTLIDCDSFQVHDRNSSRTFYTRVGTGEYLPPELMGVDFKNDLDRYRADLFAVGVLIFKFLMGGTHPYQARGLLVADAPSTEEKIKKGYFPYPISGSDLRPPAHALPYDVVPPAIQHLFYRCFAVGHSDPLQRPTAREWFEALRVEATRMRRCAVNQNHWFGGHLNSCPWCALMRRKGIDLFPGPRALIQRPVASASAIRAREAKHGPPTDARGYAPRSTRSKSGASRNAGRSQVLTSNVLSFMKAVAFVVVLFVIGAVIGSMLVGQSNDRAAAGGGLGQGDGNPTAPENPGGEGYGYSPPSSGDSYYSPVAVMNSSNTVKLSVLGCDRYSDGSFGLLVEFQNVSEGSASVPSNLDGDGAYLVDESGYKYPVTAYQGSRSDKEISLGPQESAQDRLVFSVSGGTRFELNYPDFAPVQNVAPSFYGRRSHGMR